MSSELRSQGSVVGSQYVVDDAGVEPDIERFAAVSERGSLMSVVQPISLGVDVSGQGTVMLADASMADTCMANSVILEKVLMSVSKDVDDEIEIVKNNSDNFFLGGIIGVLSLVFVGVIFGRLSEWDGDLLFIIMFFTFFICFQASLYYSKIRKGIVGNYNYSHSRLLRLNFSKSLKFKSMSKLVCSGDLDDPGHLLRLTMILANNEHLKVDSTILLEKIKKDIHRKMTAKLDSIKSKNSVKKLSNDEILEIKRGVAERYYDLMCGIYVRRLNAQEREDVKCIRAAITEIKEIIKGKDLKNVVVESRDKFIKSEASHFIEESLGGDLREFNRKVLSNFNEGGYK